MKIVGLRVVRGPDWKWGEQDGGEGSVGTVVGFKNERGEALTELLGDLPFLSGRLHSLSKLFSEREDISDENQKKSGLVKVVWDCGTQADYRAGFEGRFDLLIVDDAAGGVKHPYINCSLCEIPEIIGMRWECTECKSNFCCSCFYLIVHQHEHATAFKRYIDSSNSEPVIIAETKKTWLHLRGIFNGAIVKRGRDWSYGDEDRENEGEVLPTPGSTLREGKVDVEWSSSNITAAYRRGFQGKMDLVVVKPAIGGRYNPQWLPCLKVVSKEQFGKAAKLFSEGDRVKIVATKHELREKQVGHGGWTESIAEAIGKVGTVFKVDSDGDVHVKFENLSNRRWCLNPTVLKKLSKFSIGQIVRVLDDVDTLKAIRTGMGSLGIKVISMVAGETGRITKIDIGLDGLEDIYLDMMTESNFKPLPPMKPEWLEAVPVAFRIHDKLFKLKLKLGNLFVEAALESDLYALKDLLENYKVPVDVDHKSMPGLTALHLACRKGRLNVVEWLLEKGADIEKADEKGRTALYHAVKGGEEEVLRFLIKKGADLDTTTTRRGLTALQKAIAKRQRKCAEILIDNGCNVNTKDDDGDTPLHNAVYRLKNAVVLDGVPTLFDTLVNSGRADLSIVNKKGLSVLHVAVGVGDVRVVQYFLDSKTDADFVLKSIPKTRSNLLHIACMKGYFEIAEKLLNYVKKFTVEPEKASVLDSFVNAMNKDEQTPLMLASLENFYSLIELLVQAGANINVRDKDGATAISLIMMKIGRGQSQSSIPDEKRSREIYPIYKALRDTPKFTEIMKKYPSLSAACYLFAKGGDPEAGGALSYSSDTVVNHILISFGPKNSKQSSSRNAGDHGMTICFLCGRSTYSLPYDCCKMSSSMFCSDCKHKIAVCPCCKKIIHRQQLIAKVIPTTKEPSSSSPETFTNNSPYPLEMDRESDISDSEATVASPLSMALNGRGVKESTPISTEPVIEDMDICSNSTLPLSSSRTTPSGSKQHLPNESEKVSEKESQWTLKPKGSRKNTDLLLDVNGNTFTKRSPNIWQCTKKSDSLKNKCPALVKEKTMPDGTIKYEILKAEHKHAEPVANSRLYVQAQPLESGE